MVLIFYDPNHSYNFSKPGSSPGPRKYVAPKKFEGPSKPNSRSSLPVNYGSSLPVYNRSVDSGSRLLDVKYSRQTGKLRTNRGSQVVFSRNLVTKKPDRSYGSKKKEEKELNVTEFFKNESPSAKSVTQFQKLVYKSSCSSFEGLQNVFVRMLLGGSRINKDLFANMVQEVRRQKKTIEKCGPMPHASRVFRDHWRGDIGLALFCPLDDKTFLPIEPNSSERSESLATVDTQPLHEDETDSCDEDDSFDVCFSHEDVHDFPRLLTRSHIKTLQKTLPPFAKLMTWTRAYSLLRDGCSFETMIDKCKMYTNTLVVIETTRGDLLGGFVDQPWSRHDTMSNVQKTRSFYGGGSSFLFATNPDTSDKTDCLHTYRWSGENNYSQICDVDKGVLGMGGGGSFGWIVEDNFSRGSTGPSLTFNNPCLLKGSLGGTFEILSMEIYGFKSMSEVFSLSGSLSSLASLV